MRKTLRRIVTHPAFLVLLLAPLAGEGLSGSTPPLTLLLPWNLAFFAGLYGSGALVCREVAHRFGLGFRGLFLLGAAYGIWEEAFVDRYWFWPKFWTDSGVGHYSVVGHTNVLLAAHLTVFHAAISACTSVLLVEHLRPAYRSRAWTTRPGLALAFLALAAMPLLYGEFGRHAPVRTLVVAGAVLAVVAGSAFAFGRAWSAASSATSSTRRRGLALIAFIAVALHWVAVYSIGSTGVPWPLGVLIALTPVGLGLFVLGRRSTTGAYGADGMYAVAGLLAFFAALDVFVGLLGRYDLALGGLVIGVLAYRLRARAAPARRRRRRVETVA